MQCDKDFIKHGLTLILLAMVGALFTPVMAIPRLALSAHTIGVISGVLLIAIGCVWHQLAFSPWLRKLTYSSWLCASYINWGACLFGALVGAGRMTPIASAGATGSELAESVMALLLTSVVVSSFAAVLGTLWGLRTPREQPVETTLDAFPPTQQALKQQEL